MEFKKEFVKNNGKKVRLLAETQIEDPYGDQQILRHAGYGRIVVDGQSFEIVYTDIQGMERTDIYLYGTEKQVRMERSGSATGTLDFTLGKETLSRYYLEYGEIEIRIRTTAIECDLNQNEGRIVLIYSSGMNGEVQGNTRYTCKWKS